MIPLPIALLSALTLLLAASPATAASAAVYKCAQHGAIVYADQACAEAEALKQAPLPTVPAVKATPSPAAERSTRPAKRSARPDQPDASDAVRKKKCDKLALRRQWAEQDLRDARARPLRAQDKAADNAQRKLRRADELYRLECAAPS